MAHRNTIANCYRRFAAGGRCNGLLQAMNGLTLRSSRLAAVRWLGAEAPRASRVPLSVWPAGEGRERLSERTLGARKISSLMEQLSYDTVSLWTFASPRQIASLSTVNRAALRS